MLESLRLGIDYRVVTQPTFNFLLQLKQNIKIEELPWQKMQIQGSSQEINVISHNDFFLFLLSRFKIKKPLKIDDFYWLASIPGYVVKNKFERILSDLDLLYVNLIKVIKD